MALLSPIGRLPKFSFTKLCPKKQFLNFDIPRPGGIDPLEMINFKPNLKCLSRFLRSLPLTFVVEKL